MMLSVNPTWQYQFGGDRLWVRPRGDGATVAAVRPADPSQTDWVETFEAFDGSGSVGVTEIVGTPALHPGDTLMELRDLFDVVEPAAYARAQRAFQLLHWRRTHRFCGACGMQLVRKTTGECAMCCPACRLDWFPRLNPVVITRITRGDRILLARRARGVLPFYSVIAGFVEAGETLEHAVAREIREEVGLEVRDIRYFGSQPWPFPNNLMIGFTAEHASGEIRVDVEEIGAAAWFTRDDLPPIPRPISISRWLIDDYLRA